MTDNPTTPKKVWHGPLPPGAVELFLDLPPIDTETAVTIGPPADDAPCEPVEWVQGFAGSFPVEPRPKHGGQADE